MPRPGEVSPPSGAAGLGELARVFLRISLLGFGGPNAHIALMLDEVVERRRWLGRERFLELVAVTNLLPGPNSSEVAIHVGHTQRGVRGGLVSGLAFVLPTFAMVVGLSALYFRYGKMPAVGTILTVLNPLIVAIIIAAAWKLGRASVKDVGTSALAIAGVVTALFASGAEVAAMVVGGIVGWLLYGRATGGDAPLSGRRLDALVIWPLLVNPNPVELGRLLWVTLWTGSVLFGGGYMLVALFEPIVVAQQGWLSSAQFMDGIALTQAVPGPIVMLAAFVGYAVAGVGGAAIATFGIYLPSFAAVFVAAPLLERLRTRTTVQAVLRGVNAVVCGAILGAGLRLGMLAVPDWSTGLLLASGLVAQIRFGVGPAWLVLAGLTIGIARYFLLGA